MDTISCNVVSQEKNNKPKTTRMNHTFPPSMWGDYFINFSLDNELWEKYSSADKDLKEQVRDMLVHEESKTLEEINLIDTFERLGVAYHFEDEIEEILQKLFGSFDYNREDYDLYSVALHFRIFRQHGYGISCDAFNKFKGTDGKLKETLADDVKGMLSLYEASYLAKHGDDILDEALAFTKTRLQTMLPNLSSDLAEQVMRSMELCVHRSLPRVEARNYIDMYGRDPLRNETLLRFAKIDYNLLQLLHVQELSGVTKWWRNIISNFPYVRDRIVECYYFSLLVYFEPHYTSSRTALAKMIAMTTLLDDTFDSYGTLDELKVFTDAVEMWDSTALKLLPDSYKLLYKTLLDLLEDYNQQFTTKERPYGVTTRKSQDSNRTSVTKLSAMNLVKSYYIEAKWFTEGHMKSFDDYFANGLFSSTYFLNVPVSFLGMKEADAPEAAFDWVQNKSKSVVATATVGRLLDDVASWEEEKSRGQKITGIDCYMYQFGVSEEHAVNEFNRMVENAWKDMNEEFLKPTPVSKHVLERVINFSRLMEVTYRKGDGFTHPEDIIADVIISLLKEPIPLI